jgi:hypothetical protein
MYFGLSIFNLQDSWQGFDDPLGASFENHFILRIRKQPFQEPGEYLQGYHPDARALRIT